MLASLPSCQKTGNHPFVVTDGDFSNPLDGTSQEFLELIPFFPFLQ